MDRTDRIPGPVSSAWHWLTGRRLRVGLVVGLALVGIAGGIGAWQLTGSASGVEDQPRLFSSATVTPVGHRVDAQSRRARALMHVWFRTHGRSPHDAAFARWVGSVLPEPPSRTARHVEVEGLRSLALQRTSRGVDAATWLDDHGRDDIWKAFADDKVGELHGSASTDELDHLLDFTKNTADTLKNRFEEPSPYVVDPRLRPDKSGSTSTSGDSCTCSYPSSHAAATAAAVTYLGHYFPGSLPQFRHMQDEVDYSRLYMAGHVPSDLTGGTLLGDMLGEYYLVTRDHVTPQ